MTPEASKRRGGPQGRQGTQKWRFEEIKPRLIDRVEQLARELAPGGKKNAGYWISKNPTRADRHAGSFWIRLSEPARGAWRDEATGDKGDVFGLIEYVKGFTERRQSLDWAVRWLGLADGPADPAAARREAEGYRRKVEAEERDEAKKRAGNRDRALALWLSAEENLYGTPVDAYLKSRGIDLARLPHRPNALRFLPGHDYRTGDGELIALPCMIAMMSGPDGKCWAVHRTWLAPDGSGKAKLPTGNAPRKIWPAGWAGAAIRIARGSTRLSPEQAVRRGRRGPLIVTEGVEDALAIALACPDHRIWAAGTLGNIGKVPAMDCVSSIVVAADNDWNNPQAEKQLENSIAALRASGRPVTVARSWIGKDANDLLKGE